MDPYRILAGILMLLLGRRLFWLFVGLIGFSAGMMFGREFFAAHSPMMQLLIGIGCGIVGIFLALFLQRIAIAIAGFLAGGYIAHPVAIHLGLHAEQSFWIIFLIGGILGAILMMLLFDWALIFLSSAAGATLVVEGLHQPPKLSMVLVLILFVVGIIIQSRMMIGARRRVPAP